MLCMGQTVKRRRMTTHKMLDILPRNQLIHPWALVQGMGGD